MKEQNEGKREIKFRALIDGKLIYNVLPGRCMSMSDLHPDEPGAFDLPQETLIEQYTGLLDKNGKEIYEGDIVEFEYDGSVTKTERHVVEWEYDRWDAQSGYPDGDAVRFEEMLVIGNIHENPELLKERSK